MLADIADNPKNMLLEYAVIKHHDRPIFTHSDYGPPHDKVFISYCHYLDKKTKGEGRTVVAAEQMAANNMLTMISLFDDDSTTEHEFSFDRSLTSSSVELDKLATHLGYDSTDMTLLNVAFTHASVKADPQLGLLSNHGIAFLTFSLSYHLLQSYPSFKEGELTEARCALLESKHRAAIAEAIGLSRFIQTAVAITESMLVDTFTAMIGVLALGNEQHCDSLISKWFQKSILVTADKIIARYDKSRIIPKAAIIASELHNFKNPLQEHLQAHHLSLPKYLALARSGPAHASWFLVQCSCIGMKTLGEGNTLKAAENVAAGKMLSRLASLEVPGVRIISRVSSPSHSIHTIPEISLTELNEIERVIGYKFHHLKYLIEALTHNSIESDSPFQVYEFLGDAYLKQIISAHLLSFSKEYGKDWLAESTMSLICAKTQSRVAIGLSLQTFLMSAVSPSHSMLSDALEALIAAILLDTHQAAHERVKVDMSAPAKIIINWYKKEIALILTTPKCTSAATKAEMIAPSPADLSPSPIIDVITELATTSKKPTSVWDKIPDTLYKEKVKSLDFEPTRIHPHAMAKPIAKPEFPTLAEAYGTKSIAAPAKLALAWAPKKPELNTASASSPS